MLKNGRIPLSAHMAGEPLLVALLIAAPFLLGFDDEGAPTAVSILLGVLVLVVAASTDWRLSLVRVIPIRLHALADAGLGALLIASPFIFGFSDVGSATAFFIVMGVVAILSFLGTEWDPTQAGAGKRRGRGPRATAKA